MPVPSEWVADSWIYSKAGDAFIYADGPEVVHRKERFNSQGLLVTICGLKQQGRSDPPAAAYRPGNQVHGGWPLCRECWEN